VAARSTSQAHRVQQTNGTSAAPPFRATLACVLVIIITFVAFWPALNNQFVDWDDPDNFLRNPDYRGLDWRHLSWMFTTFHMGHYQPLTWLTLGLDSIWGRMFFDDELDPRPYHFTNVILHAANAALVLLVSLRLLQRAQRSTNRQINMSRVNTEAHVDCRFVDVLTVRSSILCAALVAALFFSVHPLRVESVAWVTERRDLLSAFFLLLSVLAYLAAQSAPGAPGAARRRWMAVTFVLFACSLLSKVIGVTLPVVLLIMDWYPLRRLDASPVNWLKPPSRRVVMEKLPFFALSLAFALIATIGQASNRWLMALDAHPLPARIMQSFYGLEFYVWKTLIPTNLLPLYQMTFPLDYLKPKFFMAAAVVIFAAVAAIALRRRAPWFLAAAAVYAIMLGPVLGLVQNGSQIVADRYSYLSCIPWAMLVGGAVAALLNTQRRFIVMLTISASAGVLITLATLTWRQTRVWRDTESLWKHTHFGDPEGTFAKNGYGFALLQKGQFPEAIALFREVLAVTPQNDKARANLISALSQNGTALLNQEQFAEAAREFEAALELNPFHAASRTNLGICHEYLGHRDEAARQYQLAIDADPNLYQPRFNLAKILGATGQTDLAIEQLRIVLRLKPDHAGAAAALKSLTDGPR
jgi:tetratricopeptide (TPR) repeat protein